MSRAFLSVEQLESRDTPCALPTPLQPGDPPPAWVCDDCAACQDGCTIQIALEGIDAAEDAMVAVAAWDETVEYNVDTAWNEPETNPFVAMYQGLSDAELKAKAVDARNRAQDLLYRMDTIGSHDYSGFGGAVQYGLDLIEVAWITPQIREVRQELKAIVQIHNSR